jgi:hypothetical protein
MKKSSKNFFDLSNYTYQPYIRSLLRTYISPTFVNFQITDETASSNRFQVITIMKTIPQAVTSMTGIELNRPHLGGR